MVRIHAGQPVFQTKFGPSASPVLSAPKLVANPLSHAALGSKSHSKASFSESKTFPNSPLFLPTVTSNFSGSMNSGRTTIATFSFVRAALAKASAQSKRSIVVGFECPVQWVVSISKLRIPCSLANVMTSMTLVAASSRGPLPKSL